MAEENNPKDDKENDAMDDMQEKEEAKNRVYDPISMKFEGSFQY
jgi:hypothetical protein